MKTWEICGEWFLKVGYGGRIKVMLNDIKFSDMDHYT